MPELRDDSIKIRTCNRLNPPVVRLRRKRLRLLQPPVEAEDPYIVAILIALAQEQRQVNRRQGTGVVTAEKATVAGKFSVNPAPSQSLTSPPSPPEATDRRSQETASSFKVRHSVRAICYWLSFSLQLNKVIGPQVHLLATPDMDPRNLYFYTAHVPAEFLDRFDMPSRFSPSSPVVISYCRIPLARLTEELEGVLCVRSTRRAKPSSEDGIAVEVAPSL
jgi:hypothetical protein